MWSITIKRLYCAQTQSTILRPIKRLGQWTANNTQSIQKHNFLYSPSTKEIYIRKTSCYEQWFASPITRQKIYIIPDTLDHSTTILIDSFPIEATKNKSTFNIQISHKLTKYSTPIPTTWDKYLSPKPEWMQQLTRTTKHNTKIEPLLHHLHTKVPLLISTDGAKGDRRSGGGWIIALIDGTPIVSGFNPNFGQIKAINSYRAEIYASLAAVLYLNMYAEYHSIIIQNKCRSICDNEAYVNKLTWLLEEDFHHHRLHKETENETLQLILRLIPKPFSIQHVLEHQDENNHESKLSLEAKLHIKTDEIATKNAKLPINTHEISSPFEVYINDLYTHQNIVRYIRSQSHKNEARTFLQKKYSRNSTTFHSIAWDHHFHIINNMPKTFKRFNLRFIHDRLPSGKMQYTHDHRCPHCRLVFDTNTPHDHFLQYYQTAIEKKQRLDSIEKILDKSLSFPKTKKSNHK